MKELDAEINLEIKGGLNTLLKLFMGSICLLMFFTSFLGGGNALPSCSNRLALAGNSVNKSDIVKGLEGGFILGGDGDGDGDGEAPTDEFNYFDVGCLVYTEIDTELPNSTSRIVYFEKEDYDPDDMHSCVEDKHIINIKVSGKYLLTSRAVWSTHSYVGGRHIGFFRVRDDSTTEIFWECTSTITGQQLKQLTNVTCELIAGDKVYMKAYQTSGVTMYLMTGGYWNTRFGVQRIGIGGDDMDVSVIFPINYWIFGAALFLLMAAVFFKKLFIYLANIPLWMGVIATAGSPYIDAAAGIVLLFVIVSIYRIAKKNQAGGV